MRRLLLRQVLLVLEATIRYESMILRAEAKLTLVKVPPPPGTY